MPKHDAALLVRQTEGWIGGMHLAALSLRNNGDRSGFIRQFSGRQREISHYLLEEVFQQQSDEVRGFLLATSILNRMNGSLCDAVTGLTDGQARLELLEQLNLFIVPLDEQREWYRYHDLFADFLRRQLRQRHAERWTQSHADAARWLEQHGLLMEAAEQLLAGNLHAAAASFIERRISDIRLPYATLLRWLSVLPEASLSEKPMLQFLHVKALIETEEWALAELKLQSIETVLTGPGWEPWLSALYLMRAELSFYQKDLNQAEAYLDFFERHMPEGSVLQTMMRNAANGGGFDRLLASVNDLRAAGRVIQKLIAVWERNANYPFVGYFYVAYGKLLYEWNRLEEAQRCFDRALRQKPLPAYERMMTDASIGAARISRARDDLEGAFELLEQAKRQLGSPDKLSFLRKLDAEKIRLSMLQGAAAEASAWLRSCGLKPSDSIPPQRAEEYLDVARALAACGRTPEASQLLTRIYRLAVQEDRLYFQIKALILQSILLQDQGDTPAAIIKLETALQLGEPHGYARSFADEGAGLAKLLSLYLGLRQRSFIRNSAPISLPYVKKLLQLMQAGTEEPAAIFPLTEQETKILRLIEQGLSNKEIAARTSVSVGTVKTHIKNLYRKLEVNNRLQAIQRGKMLNLL
ncbi:LuxR C-terminal-related transcriptional regulator [Cohnella nanjingensis]|uniref:Winged helix-turn-helix transcriptional regulator n=1 Tax=Cohnella nanjingensis TaxID=1387779 RepID=A0A7X0VDV8_9BACL|nr:LuxR C-terminal-related transcriptional regulator [Cohnella nanjingensis]MBB6670091.1 winged helix-turn-helix transcriptional regulator [Cohnella nanjingensis]